MKLHIDFETRSTIDLKEVGIDVYSRHPDTSVWCMGYTFDGDIGIWTPGDPFPDILDETDIEEDIIYAHNAAFELAIWNNIMTPRYGWPELKVSQTRCTMAMAYAMALPGGLEKAAAAVGISEQKDLKGNRLMLQMSKPKEIINGKPVWWDDPEKLEKLYSYCKQDVRVERELENRLFPLSKKEQELWELDYKINNRGIYVDAPAIKAAISGVQIEADRLNKEIRHATNNYVGFTTEVARIKSWLGTQGVILDSLAKSFVLDALDSDNVPDICRKVLRLRHEAGKTSTAKLNTMISTRSTDGRVKNTMQYHGAGTGRWAGRRIQPHNLPRPNLSQKEIEEILEFLPTMPIEQAIERIEVLYGPFTHVISDCLRGVICAAPGNLLIAGDYSNIEGRGIAWLAGEEWKLQAFRDQDAKIGPEIYKLAAAKIYHVKPDTITKAQRQIGKVAELACGYQGGVGAFQRMAKTYGIEMTDAVADDIKSKWRDAHPYIVGYWWALENSAYNAVLNPGTSVPCGPEGRHVIFKVKGSFLFCLLPSGRVLTYPYPKLKEVETPWGEMKDQVHYMTVDGLSYKWVETHTYGGKLAENITQAICRDLLAEAITRLEDCKMNVILHVHDEIVCELESQTAQISEKYIYRYISEVPEWAKGLPINVDGWVGKRYRK